MASQADLLLHGRGPNPRLGLSSRSGASPRTPSAGVVPVLSSPSSTSTDSPRSPFAQHQHGGSGGIGNMTMASGMAGGQSWPLQSPGQLSAAYMATKRRRPWARVVHCARTRPFLCALLVLVTFGGVVWYLFRLAPSLSSFTESGLAPASLESVRRIREAQSAHLENQRELQAEKDKMRRLAAHIAQRNRELEHQDLERAEQSAAVRAAEEKAETERRAAEAATEENRREDPLEDKVSSPPSPSAPEPPSSKPPEPAPTPAPATEEDESSKKAPEAASKPAAESTTEAPPAADASSPDRSLGVADLTLAPLRCDWEATKQREPCDWSWGPSSGSRSSNSEEHPGSDVRRGADWKQPQEFYSFQAAVHVGMDGPGVVVRIFQRDQCCAAAASHGEPGGAVPLPLSYFRVTATGSALAASNPPLALGPSPAAMGRGHQERVRAHDGPVGQGGGWSRDSDLVGQVDEERVLQTFLLLPDAGAYSISVRLLLFNASVDMVSENFGQGSREYEKRPGVWVDDLLKDTRGKEATRIEIPALAAREAGLDRASMPLCGAEEQSDSVNGADDRLRSAVGPRSGIRYGMPLAGRWVFNPPKESQSWAGYTVGQDPTTLDAGWVSQQSDYVPYFCRLDDAKDNIPTVLSKLRWLHFTGDSNTHYWSQTVCEMGGGTLKLVRPEAHIPKKLDAPELCIGPNDEKGKPQWIITYTNWFWGKEQTLTHPFVYRDQCAQFVEQNSSYVFRGWPSCSEAPEEIQSMRGPALTWFGWGSHAAEFGDNKATGEYFRTEESFAMPYFRHHPTLFPLTSANTPSLIPDKFGKQQVMRNNERVHASNIALVDTVKALGKTYASAAAIQKDGANSTSSGSGNNWLPVLDVFSPSHAAYEVLHQDAVHYKPLFGHWAPRWLAHYLKHAPNFGIAPAEP